MNYIAIMDRETIDKVLKYEKLIESRFSINKIVPYGKVKEGDIIYLKEKGGKVTAKFIVDRVLYFDNLNKEKIETIKNEYGENINAPDIYWKVKQKAKYGTLMYIKNPSKIEPFKIIKKNRQAFLSCNNIDDIKV